MASNNGTAPQARLYHMYDRLFEQRNVEQHAFHIIPHLKPNSRIIDVGCGIGSITMDLAQRVPDGFVVGVDHSEVSITKAKEAAKAAGINNVQFQTGDVLDLSAFESASFDISHSHQVLLHLYNPIKCLSEIHRLLKPGGIVATRDLAYRTNVPINPVFDEDDRRTHDFYASRGLFRRGGLENHIWMHEAGFAWEGISTGTAAWQWASLEERRAHAAATVAAAEQRGEEEGYVARLREEKEKWAQRPEGRLIGFDGWVVGRKEG